ncbi:Tim44/TimA family putative adaptor protein [Terasakiella pusilla]|uniref:Tim44/TimA family putative adaptor protein n=1 Tax=Terasakiella pusilla TaxID=64973 RepID=UPI003AA7F968
MANFDLILLALIAVFIFLRLRSVLGSKDGNEENRNHRDMFNPGPAEEADRSDERDNVIHLPGSEPQNPAQQKPADVVTEIQPVGPVQQALADIMEVDPNFDQHGFVEGAGGAFDMIINAFANDDRETLQNLLTKEVYQNFEQALDARKAAGETLETTVIGINSIEITDANLADNLSEVTVRIISEQVNVTTDSNGDVVDGDNNYIDTITDVWTFERDVTSKSPNWFLKATQTE